MPSSNTVNVAQVLPSDHPMNGFHVRRIDSLYDNTPSALISSVIGVAVVVLVTSAGSTASLLKPWVTFMLSILAVQGWVWHMHRTRGSNPNNARHWEFGYALIMLISGIGWGVLSGPLYPAGSSHVFVLVLTMVVAFSGAIFLPVSRLAFFMFALPAVLPGMLRYLSTLDESRQSIGFLACFGAILVLINVHETLFRLALRHLRHEVEVETLLAEQETIFQAVSAGIAVVRDGKTIKCNSRLGEILGRSLKEIQATPMSEMFASEEGAKAIIAANSVAQHDGTPFYALHLMRHANGSEFWAEVSARRMTNDRDGDMIWLISDADRRGRRSGD